MSETVDFLRTWHHGRDADSGDEDRRRVSQFDKRLQEFMVMWNGSYSGYPVHHCSTGHCSSRDEAARKMSSTFIELLLTTLPSVPAPNKWTKLFPASDFVGLGILINNFLPVIFDLAFKPVMFSADVNHDEADPRLVEGLYFQAVQGKISGEQEVLALPGCKVGCSMLAFGIRTLAAISLLLVARIES